MEIYVEAWARSVTGADRRLINEAWFTFVALDENGKPAPVPPVKAESAKEIKLYKSATERRKIRLQ
jgi:acyl-CoA hydrolase